MPVLAAKFETALGRVFAPKRRDAILAACLDAKRLEAMPVNELMDLLAA
jgi:2-methylcitrate dehydratase